MKDIIPRSKSARFFMLLFLASLAIHENVNAVPFAIEQKIIQTARKDSIKGEDYLVQIIAGVNGTWGYDIYKGKRLFIHQPTIPAVPGNTGFATKADAEKVARLAVDKMKKGETLPGTTIDELKRMGVMPKR